MLESLEAGHDRIFFVGRRLVGRIPAAEVDFWIEHAAEVENLGIKVVTNAVRAPHSSRGLNGDKPITATDVRVAPTGICVLSQYADDLGLDSKIHKVIQHNGEVKDILEFDDHPTILRYLEKIALISRRYQPKTITEVTGKDGGPIELSALSNEELEQRRQWLERELGILPPDSPPGKTLPPPPGGAKKGGV